MTPVNLAVIGVGFMGSRWARCIAEHPGARLRTVSDGREDAGKETANKWGCEYIGDPLEAASDPSVVGVVVCTPEVRHARIGLVADQRVLRGRTSIALYYGVHELDLARWYAGDIASIYAQRSSGILHKQGFA